MGFEEYADLAETGFGASKPADPTKDFFHSIYISGRTRTNETGQTEEANKLQIRGVQYNLEELYMIILHVKPILCLTVQDNSSRNKSRVGCFSFKEGPAPWYGHNNHQCGTTSAERAADPHCKNCKAQLVVSGVLCDADGNLLEPLDPENPVPVCAFIRGKGMKYSDVSDYLNAISQEDFPPLFEPVTEKTIDFEKKVVNNKRVVTKISIKEKDSNHGPKLVFDLSIGNPVDNEKVIDILKLSKGTLEKFKKKIDWSQKESDIKKPNTQQVAPQTEGLASIPDSPAETPSEPEAKPEAKPAAKKTFNFDDFEF